MKRRMAVIVPMLALAAWLTACAFNPDTQRWSIRGDEVTAEEVGTAAGSVAAVVAPPLAPVVGGIAATVYGIAATIAGAVYRRRANQAVPYVAAFADIVRSVESFRAQHPSAWPQLRDWFKRDQLSGGQSPSTEALVSSARTEPPA